MRYLLLFLLFFSTEVLQAQNLVPGYQIFDSTCLDKNPDVRYLREILSRARENEFKNNLSQNKNSPVVLEVYPQNESDTKKWKAARLKLNPSTHGWTGVFEIDRIEADEIKTVQIEKNRVIELIWKFKEILDQSYQWDIEAVFLANCKPGHCYKGEKFIPIEKETQLPPASESGNLSIRLEDFETQREVHWDLSQSLLETYRRYQNSDKAFPHRIKNQQCVQLYCRNRFEEFDTSKSNLAFQQLVTDYDFFVKHLELLIKQSLQDEEN